MAVGTYQLPSPQAVDPYPIESELVKDGPGNLGMLALYRSDRKIQGQGYEDQLAQSHEFAKQQLAAQMKEAMAKNLVDLAKVPGGVDFAAQSGVGLDIGADPAALARWGQATNLAQAAENWNKGATGFQHASEGGFLVDPGAVPGMAGMQGTLTDTSRVRAAQIQAAAHAASGGGKEQKLTLNQQLPYDPVTGLPSSIGGSVPVSQYPAYQKWTQDYARWVADTNAGLNPGPMPPMPGSKTSLGPAPAPSGSQTTSAPPAKTVASPPTAVSGTPERSGLKTSSDPGRAAQTSVMQNVNTLSKSTRAEHQAVAKDIQDGMNGTAYRIETRNGKQVVIGKSGNAYPL